jgi:uncharacterized membrane protein HdeD (DUF308 family)
MSFSTGEIPRIQSAAGQLMRTYRSVFLFEGITLIFLGIFAIILPAIATLAATIIFAWVLLIGGFVGLVATFEARHAPGFWWSLLSGLLGIVVGVLLFIWPASGALSLTVLLAIFFAVEGVASIMYAIAHRRETSTHWGWMFAAGFADLLLAGVIVAELPSTAVWVLGMLVGIDMLLGGAALIVMGAAARKEITLTNSGDKS